MTRTNMSFQEDVIDRLARLEELHRTTLAELTNHRPRIERLELHRSYLAGALAVITTLGGWLVGHPT